MLDNIVTENCMAAMPIEILADAKANNKTNKRSEDKIHINKINQSAAVKTNKTKTILNWLKNTTSSTPNHTNTPNTTTATTNNKIRKDNLNNYKRFDKIIQQQQHQQLNSFNTCTCPKENQSQNKQIVKLNETKEDDTLREFRGVQTLRHFWNKRITANRESALKAKGSKKHLTKSVSCLVNVIDSTEVSTSPTSVSSSPPPIYYNESELLRARKYRALSLHDCSTNSIDFEEISLSDIDIQKHLEKDNFYKYKTAEQASKLRQLSEHSINRKLSNGIIVSVNQKPERFDWLKRHDKFSRKKSIELTFSPLKEITRIPNNCDNSKQLIAAISATNNNDIVINEHEMHSQQAQADTAFLPTATATALGQKSAEIGSTNTNTNTSSETSTPTLTAANSPQYHNAAAVNERRPATRKDSSKTLTSASSISRDSSTTSLAASACSHKTLVKRNSSARKYSFKTHARSYHVPRKMHSNKDVGSSGGTGIIVNPSNSLVAKLTQQFNEIIQKDKTFLEEIKRKNGVLMTHKGHVYKVVDTASLNRNQAQGSKTQDANSANQALAGGKVCSSTVQKNIKKFESESKGLKPKVPLKSIKVLKKSNELVINKTMIISARFNANKLADNKTEKEDDQVEIKPHTLEMVQEETKVPLENHYENKAFQNSKEPAKLEQVTSKENEVIKGCNSSMEDIFKSNDFLVVVPPKIDSVIYKSIHRTKQLKKATAVEVAEEALESSQAPNSLLNNESHIPSPTQRQEQETQAKQNENKSSCGLSESKTNEISLPTEANTLSKPLAIESTATNSLAESDNCNKSIDENLSSPETLEEDDKKKRKHKYAKIYEKLRFFAPFSHNHKKQKLNATGAISPEAITNLSIDTELENAEREEEKPHIFPRGEYTPMRSSTSKQDEDECECAENVYSIICESEAKLLDALEQVDKKLQNLSHDKEKILESDDYGQPLIANSSFLHHTKDNSQSSNNTRPTTVIQAVNVSLVNALEGEQMIMEQKELQKEDDLKEQEENLKKTAEEEPFYEPICVVKTTTEHKTEPASNSSKSKDFAKATENLQPIKQEEEKQEKVKEEEEEEDIYQTVEEIKTIKTLKVKPTTNQELDGYEPIENPDEAIIPVKCFTDSLNTKPAHFDGYEEYTPTVEMIPPAPATVPISGRKVTDQLPDLPKPKRILPKSPIPSRVAPKPPLLRNNATESLNNMPTCHESHYYGLEENIYDTIKGSHCYESLQCVGNKLQNSPPLLRTKNSDCLSLTSNCYESISHYKRTNVMSQHSGGSSTGSTLTISSENKTNSLYEDSLISSLHYASKRIYHMNNHHHHHHANTQHHHNEIGKSSTEVNSVNGYGGSMGRKSDTSDEWTDVTDNENDDTENKLQIIIVRERSKTHKSPDWSRRVRDKRQRKSKSCIEDDDPDHFYEQLSPLTLSKRHSLFEQNRTGSLQRNQEPVRVSKRGKQMSYSAHALGQHISDDSFDSDTDDYYESEHFKNSHNDSGVDIRNTKLPDPPSAPNQMYSFVKKFKNFIVNKKSPNSSTKQNGSQQKIYDTSAQFYASSQYEGKTPPQPTGASLQVPETKELSTSEKNLILAQSAVESTQQPINTLTTPRKSKSGKSLRSRIRKSLVGFDTKQLSALTPTRSTFYIEDPTNDENNGQLDSGFSEKALSGELPTSASTPTPTSTSTSETQKLSTLGRKAKKEAKLANSQRRRTTIGGIRPHEPPPPPPPDNNSKPRRQSNTSWYAECGVFKNGTTNLVNDDSTMLNGQNNSSGSGSVAAGSTWYEEAGLYQTSGLSVASSSGSSGVSTSNEGGPADEMSHSMFSNEPLYQIYSAAKLEAISRDMQDESSTDGYEEIGDRHKNGNAAEVTRKSLRPSALQLVEPKSGPERTLWSQIPEVINSYIIPTMTSRERALMEAKFEVITSEASYLKSLNLLRTHYMNHPVFRDQNVVSSRDRKSLFSHIVPVHECSEKLLTELESCWQDNIMLIGLSKRIYTVAEKYFHVYVGFCEHQGRMDRTLKQLREGKGLFAQNLELLESSPACCGLNLHSFLMLPMQRITRLPLLIDAVFSKCHPNDDEYENWKMCLAIMNKIVTQCNEAANKSEQAFEIERISRQLEFNPSVIRPLAIAPAGVLAPGTKPRYLVKKGELTHLIWRGDDAKLTFGKKFSKTTIFAFLFSDLLVLTKRKAEEQFSVFDYCPRNMLTITSGDLLPQLPTKDLNSQTSKNLILMTLLENHERKTVELLLSCPSVSEQERWLQTMRPPESETPGEKLYEQWDCPQVIAKHVYENNEPDVLNLDVGDVVNVTRKLPDGWYKGERIRDGAVGWFPGSYTEEVNSVHVRARNLKQRHRLLTFTATYLESQKRNK